MNITETSLLGINRNIVECKLFFPPDPPRPGGVLIETLWNVNLGI